MSSVHDATLKIEVISPFNCFMTHKVKPDKFHAACCHNRNSLHDRAFHTSKTVAATCPRNMYPSLCVRTYHMISGLGAGLNLFLCNADRVLVQR